MSDNEIILRNIPFSPPDISDAEVEEVAKALKSGWITTGPRTKLLPLLQPQHQIYLVD